MKIKTITALSLCFMIAVFAGCNRKVSTQTEETSVGVITRQKPKNDLNKTNGDTLVIGFTSGSGETNPLKASDVAVVNLMWLSYDSLFTLSVGGEMENSLVENYEVKEDGKFAFTLRDGVTFHDGSPLRASDVVNSINIIKEKGKEGDARSTIYANVRSMVKSVEASGDRVVVMDFENGGISPLYALTFPVMNKNGKGTGIYKVDSVNDKEINFSYYEKSWKKQPIIKKIQAKRFTAEDQMAKAYKENTIDAAFTDHRNVGLYKYTKNTKTMNVRTNEFYYLMPNLSSGNMSNLKMRQTLSYAINKDSIVSRAFDSNAIVSDFPIPSEFYVFDNELLTYSLDVGKCIRKFGELGYGQVREGLYTYMVKDGKKFSLKIIGLKEDNLYHKIIAQTLSSQLAQIGIVCDVVLLSKEDYAKAIKNKDYDIAVANTTISSEFDLRYLVGSGGHSNYNGIKISELDNALETIATTKNDQNKIKEGYVKVQEVMVKQIPIIGLCFVTDTFIYSDRLGNVSGAYSNLDMLSGIHEWSFENHHEVTTKQRAD